MIISVMVQVEGSMWTYSEESVDAPIAVTDSLGYVFNCLQNDAAASVWHMIVRGEPEPIGVTIMFKHRTVRINVPWVVESAPLWAEALDLPPTQPLEAFQWYGDDPLLRGSPRPRLSYADWERTYG